MNETLRLATNDLVLRAFRLADAADVQRLAGDERIADTTASIPHPYPDGAAEAWMADSSDRAARGELINFAITLDEGETLVGCISLIDIAEDSAEMGYWIGVPYWGRGIATAAVSAVLEYARSDLLLRQVRARVLSRNPASARVLLRNGFVQIGQETNRCGYRQDEEPIDLYECSCPG